MASFVIPNGAKEVRVRARVFRAATGQFEDLGTISYWHKNPLKRLQHRVKQWLLKFKI